MIIIIIVTGPNTIDPKLENHTTMREKYFATLVFINFDILIEVLIIRIRGRNLLLKER